MNAPTDMSVEQRQSYLDETCGDDSGLRERVESLFQADGVAGGFMKRPALETEEKSGSLVIGRYKLLQEIGQGGFGVVYMADQEDPVKRRVALKVIKAGMDTRQVIARFEAERQALAMMDHPNISRVLDAGETDEGRPYFVMELVKGIPITEYCTSEKLSIEERLALFNKVCHAVQHAHGKGIIHRDIKPSNIMVTVKDGEPVPKVIDFGIAKATDQRLTDKTLFTRYEQMIGTPTYMSPEQAALSGVDVDTRCDIYALGVLLYELLTGTTPFDAQALHSAAFDEMRRIIREVDPPAPSTRVTQLRKDSEGSGVQVPNVGIRSDLDWIVMKCLEKDRNRRYETANGLLMDIERYVTDEPVLARPASPWYRLGKLVKRNKLAFGAAATVLVALAAGLVVANGQRQIAQSERNAAREAESVSLAYAKDLAHQVYLRQLAVADRALLKNHYPSARRALDACGGEERDWKWRFLEQRYQAAVSLQVPGYEQPLFTSDGTTILVIGGPQGGEAAVGIWDLETEIRIGQLTTEIALQSLEMAPMNQWVAGGDKEGRLVLWDFASRKEIWNRPARDDGEFVRLDGLAFSPDEQLLAAAGWGGFLRVFNTSNGAPVFDVKLGGDGRRPRFSPDGKWLVVGSRDYGNTVLINVSDRSILQPFSDGTLVAEFSPDGSMIATGNSKEKRIHLWRWNENDGTMTHDKSWSGANSSRFFDLRFFDDGDSLASSQGAHLAVWDVASGKNIAYLDAPGFPYWIGVNPIGNEIAFCTNKGLGIWHHTGGEDRITLPPVGAAQYRVMFSPDSQLLAMGTHRGQHGVSHAHQEEAGPVRIVKAETGDPVAAIEGEMMGFSWMPSSRSVVVTRAETKTHDLRDVVTGALVRSFGDGHAIARPYVDDAGEIVTSIGEEFSIRKWDVLSGEPLPDQPYTIDKIWGSGDVISPIGELWNPVVGPRDHYVAVAQGGDLRIWNTRDRQEEKPKLPNRGRATETMGFSSDGERIYAVSGQESFEIFDIRSKRRLGKPVTGPFGALDLSNDEKYLVSCGGGLVIWDIENSLPVITLSDEHDFVSVDWSPDGKRIAAGRKDGSVYIWTLPVND